MQLELMIVQFDYNYTMTSIIIIDSRGSKEKEGHSVTVRQQMSQSFQKVS